MSNATASLARVHSSSAAERRFKARYPLELNVDFRSLLGKTEFSGKGLAINVSSSGVLVRSQHTGSEHAIKVGELVEMGIEWPLMLDEKVPLRLVATGRVLRSRASDFAVAFERYEFRTRKLNQPPV